MKSKLFFALFFGIVILHSQQNNWNAVTRHSTGIGFTLISTNLERGGGGFGLEYYYTLSEEFRLGAKAQYGFYGYQNNAKENVEANSISVMPSLRIFLQEDLYADLDVGIYRESSGIMQERSRLLNNHLSHAVGAGYAIHYSPKISVLIGVRSLTVRGKDFDSIAEHQFMVCVGVAIRILKQE